MGTLFDQPVREREFTIEVAESIYGELTELVEKLGLSYEQAENLYYIALKQKEVNFLVSNGGIFDEQMMGLGQLLEEKLDEF